MAETNHGTALLTLKPLMPAHVSHATLKAAIEGWTEQQRQEAIDWASAVMAKAEPIPPRPKHCDGFFLLTRAIEVLFPVYVTVDVSKFTPEFMEDFRRDFSRDVLSLDDHMLHLARLHAEGLDGHFPDYFIEGYGPAKDMGIVFDQDEAEVSFTLGG